MATVIEALLIFSATILPPILGSLLFGKFQEANKKLTNIENLMRLWGAAAVTITVTLYVAIHQPGGFSSIGILGKGPTKSLVPAFWSTALLAGMLLAWSLINGLRNRGKPQELKKVDPTLPQVNTLTRYSKSAERNAYLTVLSLLVISEDLISRGYLVLMMANRTGILIPWIILSVLFSVVCHLYQGRNWTTVIFHSLFAIYFIGMTLITQNIIAAIAPHLYYDILWTRGVWKQLDKQSLKPGPLSISRREKLFYFVFITVNLVFIFYFLFVLI